MRYQYVDAAGGTQGRTHAANEKTNTFVSCHQAKRERDVGLHFIQHNLPGYPYRDRE